MQPTQKLTNSPFGHSGTKITWPVKYTMPVQILLPLFVTKGQRVKQSNEKNYTTITPPQCLRSTRVNRVIISTDKKGSKILIDRKLEKSLQMAQKRGTEILEVSNPADPLKSSNGEKSV
jgi:LAS superfamily LD-carboxypeptidase LdcB